MLHFACQKRVYTNIFQRISFSLSRFIFCLVEKLFEFYEGARAVKVSETSRTQAGKSYFALATFLHFHFFLAFFKITILSTLNQNQGVLLSHENSRNFEYFPNFLAAFAAPPLNFLRILIHYTGIFGFDSLW